MFFPGPLRDYFNPVIMEKTYEEQIYATEKLKEIIACLMNGYIEKDVPRGGWQKNRLKEENDSVVSLRIRVEIIYMRRL